MGETILGFHRAGNVLLYLSRGNRGGLPMPAKLSEVWPEIERIAREEGALHLGASDIEDAHASLFADWIERGHHATMSYLAKNAPLRAHPSERYPWARSVVVLLVPYASERPHAPADALSHH